ncbi:MAG: hypothetical protein Q4P06_07730 [Actinomycetaceae bacterium]|nr:hypothetical protein [Actinomycetaceae bacterium]
MYGFVLNHHTTSASLGLRLTGPVELPVARRVVDDIEVTGRAGTLTRLLGWEDTTIHLPLAVKGGLQAYQQAGLALSEATTIGLSSEPGLFRRVKYAHVGSLRQELTAWAMFDTEVVCEPFTYLDSGMDVKTLSTSGMVTNPGLLDAAPVITVYGTGTLTLTVNGVRHVLRAPAGRVTVDSRRLITHVAGKAQTDALTGPFPLLTPGVNRIELGTGISKVEIQGNWKNP